MPSSQLPATALSPRPFTVTVHSPSPFDWNEIGKPIMQALNENPSLTDSEKNSIIRRYGDLVQQVSWTKGVDWDPRKNRITLVVPNDLHGQSRYDDKNGHYVDGLSRLLTEILAEISVSRLMSYFPNLNTA